VVELYSIFIEDGDNNILDPGETAALYAYFQNNGTADAYNLTVTLSEEDPYIMLNCNSCSFNTIISGGIVMAEFGISAEVSAPVGYTASGNWQIQGDYNYSVNGVFNLVISQLSVFLDEDFSGAFPPAGWTIEGGTNWQQSSSNLAGGTIPEAKFYRVPSTNEIQSLVGLPVNTFGFSSIQLSFRHYVHHLTASGFYTLKIQTTSDGINWHDAWTTTPSNNIGPELIDLNITTPDVGSSTFQLAFVFEGLSWCIDAWYIDDVYLEGGQNIHLGYIDGNVTLNEGNGNVEDVIISAGSYMATPDASGNYSLSLPEGTYNLIAFLEDYGTFEENEIVIANGVVTTVDIVLYYMPVPINLSVETDYNDVILSWEMPDEENLERFSNVAGKVNSSKRNEKSIYDESRELSGYRIYRDNIQITDIYDPLIMEYCDESLPAGDYEYYITAVYDENESNPSNLVNITVTINPPTGLEYTILDDDVELEWNAPQASRSLSGYRIYRDNQILAESTDTTYLDTDLSADTYSYYVTAMYGEYESGASNEITVEITSIGTETLPVAASLNGNYPNPFNPETTISFSTTENMANTEISIYSMKGQKVKTLVDHELSAGQHSVVWNGTDDVGKAVSSGIYFYKMKSGNYQQTRKMILLR
jgi:hypothetical protein